MTDTSSDKRQPWNPTRVVVRDEDLPRERITSSLPADGVSPLLLGKVDPYQHFLGTLLVRRALVERGFAVSTRLQRTGILTLELSAHGETSRGFVVTTASSMEPRPIWPMLLPLAVLEHVAVDWVAACSVPKSPALSNLSEQSTNAYLLGWLSAEQVLRLPVVTLEPHLGHDFQAQYRQAKNRQLNPMDALPPAST